MAIVGDKMASLFRKLLGFILLLATIGLATCQSMLNASSDDTTNKTLQMPKGDL